ncbi:YrzI family small protein [Bacillus seohaeanensis]|jgi:uncharacterized protein (TIGR02413 family)|uniref:YrzI family small protein n=1 Tax=Bacillus seohaeanensis TaxID=284580 RepID=A0ABW5RMI0_9BACI
MTLNLLFMTVTFKKRHTTREEVLHNEAVARRFEETKIKQDTFLSKMY